MSKIKEGYNDKELEIRISGRRGENAELWLIQNGLPEDSKYQETLSYVSLQELLFLKMELEEAIKIITGLE